jgi:hypothetical protein
MKLKINKNIDRTLPIWEGKIETDMTPFDFSTVNDEVWEEDHDGSFFLNSFPNELQQLVKYFNNENVIDNLLESELGDAFFKTWPADAILDPEFLKAAIVCNTKIIRLDPGLEILPGNDSRLVFGKFIVKLDNYLLSPPTLFVGNTDWPTTDIVYQPDIDFMGTSFHLNSDTFHTAYDNNTRRPAHLLVCTMKLDPLFLVK